MTQQKSDEILLGWSEVAMAAEVGRMRYLSAIRNGRVGRHGFGGGKWTEHIEGACGEYSLAKFLGCHWDGSCDAFDRADVGEIEVRTRSSHDWDLIIRTDACDSAVYVLVTGSAPSYRIRGWIRAGDAKKPEWLKNHGGYSPAYFVPSGELHGMETLPEAVA